MHAKLLQSCPALWDPRDYNLPGSSVHGILQERMLEWVAMPSSRASSQPRDWTFLLCLLHWQAGRQAGSLPLAPLEKPWHEFWVPHIFIKIITFYFSIIFFSLLKQKIVCLFRKPNSPILFFPASQKDALETPPNSEKESIVCYYYWKHVVPTIWYNSCLIQSWLKHFQHCWLATIFYF